MRHELAINLKTANVLGLAIPSALLALADEMLFVALLYRLLAQSGGLLRRQSPDAFGVKRT